MISKKLTCFDEFYIYEGYALVNELYEDDEGFIKNHWQVGCVNDNQTKVYYAEDLPGVSSVTYSSFKEAYECFVSYVKKL